MECFMVRASGNVLLRIDMDRGTALAASALNLAAAGTTFALEPLFEVPAKPSPGAGLAASPRVVWHRARATGVAVGSAWDAARDVGRQAAAQGARVTHVEPDLIQEWPTQPNAFAGLGAAQDFKDEDDKGG